MMARRCFGHACQELEANPQVTLGLDMSRALHRALAGFEPIIDRLLDAARLREVVGNQLWLDRSERLYLKHIANPSVMLLSAAFQ